MRIQSDFFKNVDRTNSVQYVSVIFFFFFLFIERVTCYAILFCPVSETKKKSDFKPEDNGIVKVLKLKRIRFVVLTLEPTPEAAACMNCPVYE